MEHITQEQDQDKGFTLVELLIVIVILGILATVTVFAVRGITDQGQTSACNADKKTMQTAVEAYYAQNGSSTDVAEADLVTEGLIVEQSANVDIFGGVTDEGIVNLTWADTTPDNPCGTEGNDIVTGVAPAAP
jgi:general secretion pathway protein G